jgi:hypothetical protein
MSTSGDRRRDTEETGRDTSLPLAVSAGDSTTKMQKVFEVRAGPSESPSRGWGCAGLVHCLSQHGTFIAFEDVLFAIAVLLLDTLDLLNGDKIVLTDGLTL